MPKSATSTPVGAAHAPRQRDAEPVVAEEHVADPGDEHPQRRDLRRARRRSGARARRGRGPGRRRRARRRTRGPPCRSRPTSTTAVLPASARSKTSPPARGRSFTRVPTGSPTASTAAPRVSVSVRSRISRVRGSARISAFSSSVSARMFSASSPSISPPSNRSPGDSGAIRGWSSRMIGDDEHRVVADQHRPACRRSRSRRASVADTKRPPRSSVCVEQQRVPQRLLAVAAHPRRRVADRHRQPRCPSTSTSTAPAHARRTRTARARLRARRPRPAGSAR